jgi:8-oxo-dGTP pyrophosphatase MutT (NUDIX family)
MISELAEKLMLGLAALPPRRDAPYDSLASRLVPSLSYGRHRGPAPESARRAAVAIVLLRRVDGSLFIPLTRRPKSLRHHGGQVSLPGGKVELGESDLNAALREFTEELGVALENPIVCGTLPPLYVFASDNLVSPIIFAADAPRTNWQPDLLEVDQVIELPASVLTSRESIVRMSRVRQITRDGQIIGEFKLKTPAYRLGPHRIWGATAILLAELAAVLACEQTLASD